MIVLLLGGAWAATVPEGTWTAGERLSTMEDEARAAVDEAVADLGFLRRPIARILLNRAAAPCGEVRVRHAAGDEGLSITCDDQKTATAPLDGTEVSFTGRDGRTIGLVHRLDEDGAVVQTFTNKRGTRTNRLVFGPDGGLQLQVEIRAAAIGRPLRYVLSYTEPST